MGLQTSSTPVNLHSPGPIGDVTPGTIAATTLGTTGVVTISPDASGEILKVGAWGPGPALSFSNSSATLLLKDSNIGQVALNNQGVIQTKSSGKLSWTASHAEAALDTEISRAAAGVVAIRDASGLNGALQLKSPDGTAYNVTVSNLGVVTATPA